MRTCMCTCLYLYRSTKVASKVRRAAMGSELASLRRMVPISQTAKRRMSQIQLMSIATAYITKTTRLSPRTCILLNIRFTYFSVVVE